MRADDVSDRVVGCLLGLALGDALGAPFVGRRTHEIPDPVPAFELPWRGLPPGSTTDATAMALNLVRSLADRGGFGPNDVVERHLEWLRTDPPAVNAFIRRVLGRVADGLPPFEASRRVWKERGPEVSAGNGSVMYCAPLGAAYANRLSQLPELAGQLSALTHWDERCRTACMAVTFAAALLVRGHASEEAVSKALRMAVDREGGEELEFLTEAAGQSRPVDGPDRSFCLLAAGLGLQALLHGGDVESELRRVVALGGETAANAAVAGALLGARGGRSGLPSRWLERLQDREGIEGEAEALIPEALER